MLRAAGRYRIIAYVVLSLTIGQLPEAAGPAGLAAGDEQPAAPSNDTPSPGLQVPHGLR